MSYSSNQIANDFLKMFGPASPSMSVSNVFSTVSTSNAFLSDMEAAILRSADAPIQINETEEINVLGQRGIWANKSEVVNWKGILPISDYLINEDPNPEIINKRVTQHLEYIQELAVRYLRPPTPPAPGEIVITQEANILTPPAPPLIIRQQPPRPPTPEPLIIREAPPKPPAAIGRKLIIISGKRLPPAPRKVIIERLAPLPSKPQSVIIERWLPYNENIKRKVIFQRAPSDPVVLKPRNVIVQWEAPNVVVRKDYKYLGIVRANPAEYVQKYGSTLKSTEELPQFVLDIKNPDGLSLAATHRYNPLHELEGDVEALKLVDLDREGLSEYKPYLQRLFNNSNNQLNNNNNLSTITSNISNMNTNMSQMSNTMSQLTQMTQMTNQNQNININNKQTESATSSSSNIFSSSLESAIENIFSSIDVNNTGSIEISEASRVVLKLNNRMGRNYGEKEVFEFFNSLDKDGTKTLSLEEFKKALFKFF